MRTRSMVYGFMALALVGALPAHANNIRVANVAAGHQDTGQKQAHVAFDLGWENSWLNNDVNWDAAWVFVKFRPQGSNDWQHAYLSTNNADHVMAAGATADVGVTGIGGTNRGMGVFIYRNGPHTGDVNYVNTRLLWRYGENGYDFETGAQVELSVHAIEMVYVKEGSFSVGTGGTEIGSFTDGSWVSGATIPLVIESEDVLPIKQAQDALWWTSRPIGEEGELPAAFPKGFRAFYGMKYEITQGQYAEFLNLLTTANASARFPGKYGLDRHTIHLVDSVYVADRPDRACNYLSWLDVASYAAWAGLRPMTELEYEKACRGPESPVVNEYAWGTNTIMGTATALSGAEDGTETVTQSAASGGARYGDTTITGGGDGGKGPLRVGIFATNGATRITAGASYWGIMELSGNVMERLVSVGHATGLLFEGSHGAGTLSLPTDWPQSDAVGTGTGFRGGNWSYTSVRAQASNRELAATAADRSRFSGGRAARSASPQ